MSPRRRSRVEERKAPSAAPVDPSARLRRAERLGFLLAQTLPTYLRGPFRRRPLATALLGALDVDRLAVRTVERMRQRHGSGYVRFRLSGRQALLVLDPAGIRRVLERSPAVYADPPFKRRGMAHFQPHALTISRGERWLERRRFNEQVLDTGSCLHRFAEPMLGAVRREVAELLARAGETLTWGDFDRLFERIMLQVVFGASSGDDHALVRALETMMAESNRGFLLGRSRAFTPFYAGLRRRLTTPDPACLVAAVRGLEPSPDIRAENQIPHWMFATKSTLAANSVAALALIAAHRPVDRPLRRELSAADPGKPKDLAGLALLRGCLREATRLWPTTPLIAREALRDDRLGEVPIAAGTQVLIFNLFNHRDRARYAFADRFAPEVWTGGDPPDTVLPFSGGQQACAGEQLAIFLGTAVLAGLLEETRYELRHPRLDPARPLPYSFDPFRVRLVRRPPQIRQEEDDR